MLSTQASGRASNTLMPEATANPLHSASIQISSRTRSTVVSEQARPHSSTSHSHDMAEQIRLAKLPGYDTAPDVYETPELASDTSVSQSAHDTTSESANSDTETPDSDEDGPFAGISRRKLYPARARSRFQAIGSRVEARGLDLSDRVDGRRRGLNVRQRRAGQYDGEDETLEARIARLRREVEECRVLAKDDTTGKDSTASIQTIGTLIAELESRKEQTPTQDSSQVANDDTKEPSVEVQVDDQILNKITAFDGRLSALERALGISSMDMDNDGAFTAPVLPTIDVLDRQISALMASTSIAQLDANSSRIKKLTQEAEQFSALQSTAEKNDEEEATLFSADDMKRLNALYGLLPKIQGLAPTVPALLERLRSLTALHTGAASAASELDELVKKQADMAVEIKSWEEALKRSETVVKDALQANGKNGNTVRGWVDDLQKRIEALS